MPSPPSYGCCTRVNFVLKKHLLFQMNLSNSGLKNRSIKEYWLIFTVLKFPLGLQFSYNLTKFKIIKYISTIYIMTTTCTYLQQLTQVSDVAHGPLVCLPILLVQLKLKTVNHISLRKAKIVCNFGLSECNRVKDLCQYQYVLLIFNKLLQACWGRGGEGGGEEHTHYMRVGWRGL